MQKHCEEITRRCQSLKKETDPSKKITVYIEQSRPWAGEICNSLRNLIKNADPSITEEFHPSGLRYSSPHGLVCNVAIYIKTVSLVFYNGAGMKDKKGILEECPYDEYSKCVKFREGDKVDEKLFTDYVKESVKLNANGFIHEEKAVEVPEELTEALAKDKDAKKYFNGLAKSYKREFVVFVTSAKQEKTKMDRIAKVVDYCSRGETLNEKYLGKGKEEKAKKAVKRAEPNNSEESEEEAVLKKVKKTKGRPYK